MTEITNPWFFEEIKLGIKKIISNVGDRNVIDKIKKNKSFFGFETLITLLLQFNGWFYYFLILFIIYIK